MQLINNLNQRVSNKTIVWFRIAFGLLMAYSCFFAVYRDTISYLYLKPKHLFHYIGFEWIQPLPGMGMYWYYGTMALLSLFVAAGFLYRYSLGIFTVLWTYAHFIQKSYYNNHHYLIILLCLLLLLMPANNRASVDAALNAKIKDTTVPRWCGLSIVLLFAIVYFYAAITKLYPAWMDGSYLATMYAGAHGSRWAPLLQNHWLHLGFAWFGILFDMFIIPVMLCKRTRIIGVFAMLFFHLFNFFFFEIGIFPLLSLAVLAFFFQDELFRGIFNNTPKQPGNKRNTLIVKYLLIPFFIVQLLYPLRHFLIEGNVIYTEEGNFHAWKMKAYIKTGTITFRVRELPDGPMETFDPKILYNSFQISRMKSKPDMIWQAAQQIKQEYAKQGKKVAVYATTSISLNGKPERLLVDPNADLAAEKWDYFFHNKWTLPNND